MLQVALLPRRFSTALLSEASLDMSANVSLKELIEFIAKALVDKPDEVDVSEISGEQTVVLELRVAKEDLGKVIGRGGAHASAIRTLMAAASGKEKKRYILEIVEH